MRSLKLKFYCIFLAPIKVRTKAVVANKNLLKAKVQHILFDQCSSLEKKLKNISTEPSTKNETISVLWVLDIG